MGFGSKIFNIRENIEYEISIGLGILVISVYLSLAGFISLFTIFKNKRWLAIQCYAVASSIDNIVSCNILVNKVTTIKGLK